MPSCVAYTCPNVRNVTLHGSQCIQQINDVFYVQPCGHGYVCDQRSEKCTFPPSALPESSFAYVNEPCTYSMDCKFGTCKDGYCRGAEENAVCTEDDDCEVGLYCYQRRNCKKQSNAPTCFNDEDCLNGFGCNITDIATNTGLCVSYYSINPGRTVGFCDSDWSQQRLCSSGTCLRIGEGRGTCTAPVKTNGTLPLSCEGDDECVSTEWPANSGQRMQGKCQCGYDDVPASYCTLFPGDPIPTQLRDQAKKWYKSEAITHCNTAQRHSTRCMELWWSPVDYATFMYLQAKTADYTAIHYNSVCTKLVFTQAYWSAHSLYLNARSFLSLTS